MKKSILVISLFAFSLTTYAQLTSEDINVTGEDRTYYQYLPTGFDPLTEDLPVVIILHGIGGSASSLTAGEMNDIADTARFIPVYLQGLPNSFGQTSWNNGTGLASSANDLEFFSDVIDTLNAKYSIDLSRVYMMGISMGSIMTYHACNYLSDRIAAVACHIGTMSDVDAADFTPLYKAPTMHVHGTDDTTVPYDSGKLVTLSLVPTTIETLKGSHGFLGDSTITNIPDNESDGVSIEKIEYNATVPFELWKMNGAGHIFLLPGINDTSGFLISWHYFNGKTHPNPSTLDVSQTLNSVVDIFPNPTANSFSINYIGAIESVEIYDINGALVHSQINVIAGEQIDISTLTEGMYMVRMKTGNGEIFNSKLAVTD